MNWEQDEAPNDIPIYKVTIPITKSYLTLHIRGDQHIGAKGINIEEMKHVYKREQDQHRGNIFVFDTGDYIENQSKKSPGHNYDVDITDPAEQLFIAQKLQLELDEHLYGSAEWAKMSPITKKSHAHARRCGVIGNHEYRDRRDTGKWINRELYSSKGVIDAGVRCIVNITLVNAKLKLKRSYDIYLAHRLTSSSESISLATLAKNFSKVKSDVNADIYICGHYHKKITLSDMKYDNNGKKKRVMFATNPSPLEDCEYSVWNLFSPNQANYYNNIYLPIDPSLQCFGKV